MPSNSMTNAIVLSKQEPCLSVCVRGGGGELFCFNLHCGASMENLSWLDSYVGF